MRSILFMLINAVWMTLLLPMALLAMLLTLDSDSGVWMARTFWSPFLVRRAPS
jgi:hypothetical protein